MSMLSEKELTGINELLGSEELLIKKFQLLASEAENQQTKCLFENISAKHQRHFDELYSKL